MGGSHTQVVVTSLATVFGNWHSRTATGPVNEIIRKVGHFFGYGIIGLFFRNAWFRTSAWFHG